MFKNTKIAVYCRVSSDEQAERGTIDNQITFAQQYADLHHLDIYDVYKDDGVTGTIPLQDRPEGHRLLQDAADERFTLVVFYKMDRLGRSTRVILNAVEALSQHGVGVQSMSEPFDTATPSGRFMLTMFAGVAELDRANILDRMYQGTLRHARLGKWCGGPAPFGYRLQDGYLVISEEPMPGQQLSEADVIRMLYSKTIEGWSALRLAQHLNALGVPNKYTLRGNVAAGSGKWHQSKILYILHNTLYYGERSFGKMSKNNNKNIIPQQVPAIVSKETWDAAQAAVEQHSIMPKFIKRRSYLLRGLIRCGLCGHTYVGTYYKRKAGNSIYYVCNAKNTRGVTPEPCKGQTLRGEWIESLVWEDCLRYIKQPDVIAVDEDCRYLQSSDDIKKEIDAATAQLKQLDQERQTVISLCRQGIITAADLDGQLSEITEKQNTLQQTLDGLNRQNLVTKEDAEKRVKEIADILDGFRQQLQSGGELSFDAKQGIIRTLVKQITVHTELQPGAERDIPTVRVCIDYNFTLLSAKTAMLDPYRQARGWNMPALERGTLAYKIRENRINAGLTIKRLAELSGVTACTIGAAEHGKSIPNLANIAAIAAALNIPSYVFTEADKMPEETLLQRLDKARVMRCLSWPALAKDIGVDVAELCKFKQGRKVWSALIEQIVKWLDNSNN